MADCIGETECTGSLPRLYAIADAGVLRARGVGLREFAEGLRAGGVKVVQYRNKSGTPQEMLADAAVLQDVFAGSGCLLVMNDRVDLAVLAGFGGVHVGQGDLSPEDARAVMENVEPHPSREREGWGTRSGKIVGISTHTLEEVRVANASCADYIAVGPVFATGTKQDASPVVGLEGVRLAREVTDKPLVAIGGITLANAGSVIDAGADTVAVISALIHEHADVTQLVRGFHANLS